MKKHKSDILSRNIAFIFVLYALTATRICAIDNKRPNIVNDIEFGQLSSRVGGLPCDETSVTYQDREGFIWIGTRLGLDRYDGYSIKTYKNDIQHPHLFTSSDVKCITDDGNGHLWFGTFCGVNMMDKRTGKVKQFHFKSNGGDDYADCISDIGNGKIFMGNDNGLYIYDIGIGQFRLLHGKDVPSRDVKSLFKDSKGYVWVGTRRDGVYRYDTRHGGSWYHLPMLSENNSAQAIYEDCRHRIWIGTWGNGIILIREPYRKGVYMHFSAIRHNGNTCNYINSISEFIPNHTLWIGTTYGLSIYNIDKNKFLGNYPYNDNGKWDFINRGVNKVMRDRDGRMWLCVNKGGIITADAKSCGFTNIMLTKPMLTNNTDIVNSIANDSHGNRILIGLNICGIATYDFNTKTFSITDYASKRNGNNEQSEVNAVITASDGSIMAGTHKYGILKYVNRKLVDAYNTNNRQWIKNNCVYCFQNIDNNKMLVGTWTGLCIMDNNGNGRFINKIGNTDISKVHILNITCTGKGDYWLSLIFGIIHATGDINHPEKMKISVYSNVGVRAFTTSKDANEVITSDKDTEHYKIGGIYKILKDHRGRIWACTSEPGLLLYDHSNDTFNSVSAQYGISGDNVHSIEEDGNGFLWLSTNYGIARMKVSDDNKTANIKMFTMADGLPDNYYGNAVSCMLNDGRICFGNYNSITVFNTKEQLPDSKSAHIGVTDIKIFNKSINVLDNNTVNDITETLPPYTRDITLNPDQNDIQLDFSTFNYSTTRSVRYAYMLDGYDKEWIYTEGSNNSAYYSNLPSGTYKFMVKATNKDGMMGNEVTTMNITILPPLWLRWWAYIIYSLLIVAAVYAAFVLVRRNERQKQAVHIARMEKEKTEELNHNKLQFFTNITHDLMTPLTVISATIDSMRSSADVNNGNITRYKSSTLDIIQNNINRLMRLLQQILEFRKAETGNLSLQASFSDIVDFCRREVESIAPLMKSKQQTVTFECKEQRRECMFDTDVMDKIIYNLLSNASKYNRPSGGVKLSLSFTPDYDHAIIKITDNGFGIAKEKISNIFKRFYESEHRHFNTYGTGIGLSLTHDLVTLHHGTINVESTPDVGTTFTVSVPVTRQAFNEKETDNREHVITDVTDNNINERLSDNNNDVISTEKYVGTEKKNATVLFVEDNVELRQLVFQLLSNEYNVITAENGKEAIEMIKDTENNIDIIVSDIMMPEMDGIEMTKIIKSDINTSHIPLLLLTAKRTDEDRTEAYNVGADGYLTKPFKVSLLNARIHNLLRVHEQFATNFKKNFVVELSDIPMTDIDKNFIKKCTESIRHHLSDTDFDQQVLMTDVGASHSTLYRKLKALTGMDATAFIRNMRLKIACSIIEKNPGIRISDLAYKVGYGNPKYFATCFRNEFGMTPTEYVEKLANKNNDNN